MDSPQTKSGLNLPAGMTQRSLRLETFSGSFRAISSLSSPSKTSTCSDRFIPCRSSSRLHTFGLNEKASPVKEGANEAYSRLLKSELFGSDFASFSPAAGSQGQGSPMSSPSKNMLRFKTDHSAPNSPYSPSIFSQDPAFPSEISTPPKPPRKVPKTPHKVSSLFSILTFSSWTLFPVCVVSWVLDSVIAGSWCSLASRWLLLESCRLVLTECVGRGTWNLRLLMECIKLQGKFSTTNLPNTSLINSYSNSNKWVCVFIPFSGH